MGSMKAILYHSILSDTVLSVYHMVIFLQDTHMKHSIACPEGNLLSVFTGTNPDQNYKFWSGHETAAVLLPGFAINW